MGNMKNSIVAVAALLSCLPAIAATGDLTLIGKVPGRYLNKAKDKSYLAKVEIKKGVIDSVVEISESEAAKQSGKSIILKNSKGKYDVIYPGLMDLHNHTKQNNLPLWSEAKGQFANRFEWRGWSNYKNAVSMNMNPWIGEYGKVVSCAAFRWSELQAMVLGTTYLQGPSSCIKNFAIHHVEGGDGFLYSKTDSKGEPVVASLNVSAPTDVIYPNEFTFVWEVVKQKMKGNKTFAQGLEEVVYDYCPSLKSKVKETFEKSTAKLEAAFEKARANLAKKKDSKTLGAFEDAQYNLKRDPMVDTDVIKLVSNKKLLEKSCSNYHSKFLRYMSFLHSSIAGKIKLVDHPHRSAVIAHLAEGRQHDPYNTLEFELLKLLGLDAERFNLVHGVGIDKKGFQHMAKKGMGLIWSPFSNLLLYGQTADIAEAKKAGVLMALGSDWTPTGSKSVLEELKIARNYVRKNGLATLFSDEELYKMVTENSAEMLGHLEKDANDGRHGAGKVVKDAVGTLIVVRENESNPHTNLVTAESNDINLVIIHGQPLYGNVDYLKANDSKVKYEELPSYLEGMNDLIEKDGKGVPTGVVSDIPVIKEGEDGKDVLVKLMKNHKIKSTSGVDSCGFDEVKGMVFQNSLSTNNGKSSDETHPADDLLKMRDEVGVNLDRVEDLQRLLGSLMMTQGRNILGIGNAKNAISYFPSLFSCNDKAYSDRLEKFVAPDKHTNDEITANEDYRLKFRKKDQDARDRYNASNPDKPRKMSDPESLATDYGLPYDTNLGVRGY